MSARYRHRTSRQTVRIPVDVASLAYAAGIIDGEGHISRHAAKSPFWTVGFDNTDEALMAWWSANFGGSPTRRYDYGATTFRSRKPLYRWTTGSKANVEAVLAALLPYLVIKRGLAEVALKEIRASTTVLIRES